MKKIYLLLSAFALLTVFTSCEDKEEIHVYDSGEVAYFSETSSAFFVTASNPSMMVEVVSTSTSSAARTYNITVDPSSTAMDGVDYTLGANSLTIPAGEYTGSVSISGIFDGALETGSKLVLNLTGGTGVTGSFDQSHSIDIFKLCESNIAGNYEVTTTYGYHDFLPDYNPNTEMTTIDDVNGMGTYTVFDFSGGLYSTGPYSGAYGTGGADNTLTFTDVCGNISWSGQTDPWGDILMDGTNSVDATTGEVTISWFCTGYGESGVSVYVPQ